MNRENWIEEVGQSDAMCFGDEPEDIAVAIEAPRPSLLDEFEARFVVAVEKDVRHLPRRIFVGELECLRAKPLDVNDRYRTVRQDSAQGGVRLELFECCHPDVLCLFVILLFDCSLLVHCLTFYRSYFSIKASYYMSSESGSLASSFCNSSL